MTLHLRKTARYKSQNFETVPDDAQRRDCQIKISVRYMSLQAVYVDVCLQLLQFPLMREMKKRHSYSQH